MNRILKRQRRKRASLRAWLSAKRGNHVHERLLRRQPPRGDKRFNYSSSERSESRSMNGNRFRIRLIETAFSGMTKRWKLNLSPHRRERQAKRAKRGLLHKSIKYPPASAMLKALRAGQTSNIKHSDETSPRPSPTRRGS